MRELCLELCSCVAGEGGSRGVGGRGDERDGSGQLCRKEAGEEEGSGGTRRCWGGAP